MSSSAAEAHSQRPPSPSASSTLSSSRTPWPTGHYNNPIFIDDGCVEPPGSSASHNTQPAAVPVPSTTSYSGVPSNAVTKASSDNNIQAQSNQFSHPPAAAAVAVAASSQSTKSVPAPPRRPFPVGCPSDTASSSANTPTDFGSRSPQYVNSPRARSTLSTSTSASSTNMEIPRHAHHHHQRQQQQPVPSVALPTWQPDSEVTKCPICDVQFTFFYRKHHCRRCGQVVCASCSPHRLPIPRQYIVEQPLATDPYSPASRHDAGHLTEARTGSFSYPSDGWLAPLEGERDVRLCNQCAPNLQNNTGGQGSPANANSRSQFPAWYSQYSNRPRASTRQGDYSSSPRSPYRRSNMSPAFSHSRPPHRPPIDERDFCPVCFHRLPAGSETARETHIIQCIERRTAPDPSAPPSSGPRAGAGTQRGDSEVPLSISSRMVFFTATDKDCGGAGGGAGGGGEDDEEMRECLICMEDYTVGAKLARLECLCKFHKSCIIDWFQRKAECPVHKMSS